MNARQIRGWLLIQPRPSMLRITSNGNVSALEIAPGQSWIAVATSVEALEPDLVEAFAGDKLLRAVRPNDQEAPPDDDAGSSSSPSYGPPPAPSSVLTHDASVALLDRFAHHIAEAYRHATDVSFDRLVSMFDAVNQRSEAAERARDAIQRAQIKALENQIEATGAEPVSTDPLTELVGAFMGGLGGLGSTAPAATTTTPAAPNGHSNGAPKAKA